MITRRNSLRQIIALGLAPAIIRVAPLMRINPALAAPDFYRLCKLDSPVQGVLMSLWRSNRDSGWLLVARNTTAMPLMTGGIRLLRGEERVVCTSSHLRRYALSEPPPLDLSDPLSHG